MAPIIVTIAIFGLISTGFALFMPACKPFFLHLTSIKEIQVNREYFGKNTKLYIYKTGKCKFDYEVRGCNEYMKQMGPITAKMGLQVKDAASSNNDRWNQYQNNFMNLGMVCNSPIMKPFFDFYQNPQVDNKKCVFEKHITCLKGIDMDAILHKALDSVECGPFKIFLKYFVTGVADPILVYEVMAEVVPRSEMENAKNCTTESNKNSNHSNHSKKGNNKGKKD